MPIGAFRLNTLSAVSSAYAGPTSIPYQYNRSGTTNTGPGTVSNDMTAAGDIAICFASNTNVSATKNIPSGWIEIADQISAAYRTSISYRIIVAGDIGTQISSFPAGGSSNRSIALFFRPNTAINSVVIGGLNKEASSAAPTNQTLTVSGTPNLPTIGFASYASTGAITTRGWTSGSPTEVVAGTGPIQYSKHLIYTTTPTNTTISQSDGGTDNVLISFYMSFT
jgi:hypothetical protein